LRKTSIGLEVISKMAGLGVFRRRSRRKTPKNLIFEIASAQIIANNRIIVIQRFRHPANTPIWPLPASAGGAILKARSRLAFVEIIDMFNRDLFYSVNQTRLLHAVCRRAGIPRHTNAPKRSHTRGAPG